MNKPLVNINVEEMSKAVQTFVRARAIKFGSLLIYQEDNKIVQEDPRTGHKTTIQLRK